jgi:hypothetical protein
MFLLRVTPGENVEHVQLIKWSFAILSFATDPVLVLAVAKSSSATVATDQLCSFATTKLSFPTVATNHVAVAKISIATKDLAGCDGCDDADLHNRPSPFGCDAPFATVATGQLFER